jgi:hypothetical protein
MRLIFIILTPIAPHTGCAKWYSYIKYADTHRHVPFGTLEYGHIGSLEKDIPEFGWYIPEFLDIFLNSRALFLKNRLYSLIMSSISKHQKSPDTPDLVEIWI